MNTLISKTIGSCTLYCGNCEEVLPQLDIQVTACVTDPPYGISFMGKNWDHGVPSKEIWSVIQSKMLPGATLLAFGSPRMYHRLACAIEDASFQLRDCLMWIYSVGFPKSHNIGKKVVEFNGYGTALKPAWEPIILAMNPSDLNFTENAKEHGVSGINIDGTRVGPNPGYKYNADKNGTTFHGNQGERIRQTSEKKGSETIESTKGRWPSNVLFSHTPECVYKGTKEGKPYAINKFTDGMKPFGEGAGHEFESEIIPTQEEIWECSEDCPVHQLDSSNPQTTSGQAKKFREAYNSHKSTNIIAGRSSPENTYCDSGGVSRFFYCAKASVREKTCEGTVDNNHPTVKPKAIMAYLLKLVKMPKKNLILDPFMGSGTTGVACVEAGLPFVGIEQDPHNFEIACQRIQYALDNKQVNLEELL